MCKYLSYYFALNLKSPNMIRHRYVFEEENSIIIILIFCSRPSTVFRLASISHTRVLCFSFRSVILVIFWQLEMIRICNTIIWRSLQKFMGSIILCVQFKFLWYYCFMTRKSLILNAGSVSGCWSWPASTAANSAAFMTRNCRKFASIQSMTRSYRSSFLWAILS